MKNLQDYTEQATFDQLKWGGFFQAACFLPLSEKKRSHQSLHYYQPDSSEVLLVSLDKCLGGIFKF
jgi:hypothetical protein